MAIYDPGDTVPVRDVDPNEEGPLLAVTYAEEHKLGPNDTIINTFTQDEKQQLLKMIKKGEFSQLEAGIIRSLMSEAATLEEVGAMIGAVSRRTGGAPASKPAAIKEINRILKIVAKRSKALIGKEIDLNKISAYRREQKRLAAWRAKKAREAKRYANDVEKEYWKLLKELRATQKAHGLKPARQVHRDDWTPGSGNVPFIHDFAAADKNIDAMPQFGGKAEF